MKIGVFDPYLDTLGGGEKYMLSSASCLSSKHDVYVIWDEPEVIKRGEKKFGLDLSRVKTSRNFFTNNYTFNQKLIESNYFDAIFYLSDGSIPLVGSKLYIHFQFPIKKQKENILISKTKRFRVSKFICNSNYTKSYIDKEFKVKSLVLYPPVDDVELEDFKKENLILTVGRYQKTPEGDSFKKQEFLINAFKKLPKNDYQFIVVTSKEKEGEENISKLRELARGFSIKIIEEVSREELNSLYSKSKIYWHASGYSEDLKKYPERAEHFGITTVEAMLRLSVPVVIKAGGQEEIVEDNKSGYLFETEKQLIDKTSYLIQNEKAWEQMAKEARKKAEYFSGQRFCLELDNIIK